MVLNALNRLVVEAQVRKDEGQGMVEYGLIIALVSVVAIAVLGLLGDGLVGTFQAAVDELGGGT